MLKFSEFSLNFSKTSPFLIPKSLLTISSYFSLKILKYLNNKDFF
jgi:hypothetical protein